MADVDIIKESIDFEEPLDEIENSTLLRGEHLIPDTHPDVDRILSIDAKPMIRTNEISGDKIHMEGIVEYNLLYISREEDEEVLNSVPYSEDFSCVVEVPSSEHRIYFDAECGIEHIQSEIINERKIKINGVLKVKCIPYKNESFEFVKDITGKNKVEMLKEEEVINKVLGKKEIDLDGKTSIVISMDKPQIGKILNYSSMLHKKEIKLSEDKVYVCCFCKVNVLYRAMETNDIILLEDDVFISTEEEFVGVTSDMKGSVEINLLQSKYSIEEDDLGEYRKLNLTFSAKAKSKILQSQKIDIIKDAYSPEKQMEIKSEDKNLIFIMGDVNQEVVVKDNIILDDEEKLPSEIIYTTGRVEVSDKKIQEERVEIEGYAKINVMYKSIGENKKICTEEVEVPFTSVIEINNVDESMKSIVKASIENVQADVEGKSIAVKTVISVSYKAFSKISKGFITDIEELEAEKQKKASLTIYVMQPDDTLWSLAKNYATTVEDICKINNIEDIDENMQGKKLIIPGRVRI